mgnify:CR=1 FL=1
MNVRINGLRTDDSRRFSFRTSVVYVTLFRVQIGPPGLFSAQTMTVAAVLEFPDHLLLHQDLLFLLLHCPHLLVALLHLL